jgi:hypothetical protein
MYNTGVTPVPLELPLRPAEAAELAHLIFDQAERKSLTDEVRNRLAARARVLRLSTITPYFGSLGRDPVHPSAYYLAVDGEHGVPHLLYIALANAPTSSIFHHPLLIGRMRRHHGPEFVINAMEFGPLDHENLEKFAACIDSGFLPRPQGLRAAIAVRLGADKPAGDAAAAFEAFRAILKRTGKNLAAVCAADCAADCRTVDPAAGATARDAYYAGLWAAIRAGWREEYSAGTEIAVEAESLDSASLDRAKESILAAAGFTRFATNTARLLRQPASGAALQEQFEAWFPAAERGWILDEFVRRFDIGGAVYELTAGDVPRLAVKWSRCLKVNEHLHEYIRQTRGAQKVARTFDFEPVLGGPGLTTPLTTPQELLFCLHWLKARGHAAQMAAPNLGFVAGQPYLADTAGELGQRVTELAAIARHYQAILSVRHGGGKQPEVIRAIAKATVGRVNYQTSDAAEIAFIAEELLG